MGVLSKSDRRNRIRKRVRKISFGTGQKPRLTVFKSNKEIYAQIVDDTKGVTLYSSSTKDKDFKGEGTPSELAKIVGQNIAGKAIGGGIDKVCFDRAGYLYHGRVKALADGAREKGLDF